MTLTFLPTCLTQSSTAGTGCSEVLQKLISSLEGKYALEFTVIILEANDVS